jgi:hypothetical protein
MVIPVTDWVIIVSPSDFELSAIVVVDEDT